MQVDTALWAIMRYPKGRPVEMIKGLANANPGARRVNTPFEKRAPGPHAARLEAA